jgi:hypothetical protein
VQGDGDEVGTSEEAEETVKTVEVFSVAEYTSLEARC